MANTQMVFLYKIPVLETLALTGESFQTFLFCIPALVLQTEDMPCVFI